MLSSDAITAITLDTSTKSFTVTEVRLVIRNLNPKKTSNYNVIINQILQKLSEIK